jgi:EPS-associated MarR family transcriptional regulator
LQNDELTLDILRHAESIRTQQSLAEQLGYSVGKINYVLKALIAKGLIKAERFATSDNKRQYRYLLTREGIEAKIALTEQFIERKKREYEELIAELETTKKDMLCKH